MQAADWIKKALDEANGKEENTIFSLAFIYGTNGGTFPVEFNGFVSAPLAYPPSASQLKTALESLQTIRVGGCKVKGPIGGPFEIEMIGDNAGQALPPISVDGSNLIPAQEVEVEILQQGQSDDYSSKAAQMWADHVDDAQSMKHRYLLVKKDILNIRLNKLADSAIDQRTGQINVTESKDNQRYTNLERQLQRVEEAIQTELIALSRASSRVHGGVIRKTTPNGRPYGVMARDPRTGRFR